MEGHARYLGTYLGICITLEFGIRCQDTNVRVEAIVIILAATVIIHIANVTTIVIAIVITITFTIVIAIVTAIVIANTKPSPQSLDRT